MATPDIRFQGFTGKWKTRQFSETSNMGSGGTPNVGIPGNYGGLIPFIRSGEIDKTETQLFITNRGLHTSSARLVAEGDLLLAIYGGSSGSIEGSTAGESAISKINGAINQAILAIYPSVEFDKLFMLSWFKAHKKEIIGTHLQGSQGNLSARIVGALDYVSPTLDEQSSIGIFLSKIDELLAKNKDRVSQLRKYKQSMLVKMFPQDGASVPEIRFEGFTGDWEENQLSQLAVVKSAARVHKNQWKQSGVPFFRTSDITSLENGHENSKAFISYALYEELSAKSGKLRKGDLLVVGGGSIGTPYQVPDNNPLYSKDADLLWVQINEKINSDFLVWFFKSEKFQKYLKSISHAGTISHYTIEQAKQTPIPHTSLEEQTAIGSYFRQLDKLIELEETKLAKLTQLKTAFLSKMFV